MTDHIPATGPPGDPDLEAFWVDAKIHANLTELASYLGERPLSAVLPPAWAFGGSPAEADHLLALVLAGTKTAMSSGLWEYTAAGEELPSVGQLSILLDSAQRPRALIRTDTVRVVPYAEVDDEHALAEGQGEVTGDDWRRKHAHLLAGQDPAPSPGQDPSSNQDPASDQAATPVVLERFSLLFARGR